MGVKNVGHAFGEEEAVVVTPSGSSFEFHADIFVIDFETIIIGFNLGFSLVGVFVEIVAEHILAVFVPEVHLYEVSRIVVSVAVDCCVVAVGIFMLREQTVFVGVGLGFVERSVFNKVVGVYLMDKAVFVGDGETRKVALDSCQLAFLVVGKLEGSLIDALSFIIVYFADDFRGLCDGVEGELCVGVVETAKQQEAADRYCFHGCIFCKYIILV